MIEEIGEIFYTLVIGYIGALELCYIAKHIYHSCHNNLHSESEETRLKELADLQSQLQKAVVESEQNQVEGYQVAKDGVLYKDGYRVNVEETNLRRNKRQIDSTQLPSNNDIKNDEINLKQEDTFNEIASVVNTNAIEVQSQFKNETNENDLEKSINNELKTKTKIGENESDSINLEDSQRQSIKNKEKENNKNDNETHSVNDFNAKKNENVSIILPQQLNDAQKNNETKTESVTNLTDVLIPQIEEKLNENIENKVNENQLAESDSNVTFIKDFSNEMKLNKKDEIINNESSTVEMIENNNNLNKEEVEEIISAKTQKNNLNSEVNSFQTNIVKNDLDKEIIEFPNESESQITETLRKLDHLNQFVEEVAVLSTSSIQRHDDTESSADEEENSIASVIENKNHKKESDDQYKIVLTEEETEKVINSNENDFKFKNLADVLNATDSTKEFVIETALEEEDDIDDNNTTPEEKDKNYDEEENLFNDDDYEINGNKPLRRSPRMDEIDHYEERWQIEDSSYKKQISESEALINAEKAEYISIEKLNEEELATELIEQKKQKEISESEALINAEKAQNISNEKLNEEELATELIEQSKQKEISESEELILRERAEAELSSKSVKAADKEAGKLTLDITKSIINDEQCLTPSIELFDETGAKSPEVNFESGGLSSQPLSPSFDIMEGLSDFYDFNISINPSISRSLSRSTSVVSTDENISSRHSRSASPISKPPIPPKKIEYLSDFYDFSVTLNRAVYRRSVSRERVYETKNTTQYSLQMTPYFNYTFRELDALSNLSVCSLPFEKTDKDFKENLNLVNRIESSDFIQPDPNFIRSHYVGESTDYSYDFEELREQTRHFVRSRSPSISFESDMVVADMNDYRKEIQNNILKELEEKSLHSTGVGSFVERERRESDSALINNSEIILEIQEDPDYIITYKDDSNTSIEKLELEPEEYHHFRRFSLQQEIQFEEYPEDDFVYLDDSTLKLIEPESNDKAVEDSVLNLEDLSLSTEETNELIIKTLTEGITPDFDEIEEDLNENKKSKMVKAKIDSDDFEEVDLTYVPKKEYKWRQKFKIDEEEQNIFVQSKTKESKRDHYIEEAEDKEKFVEEDTKSKEINKQLFEESKENTSKSTSIDEKLVITSDTENKEIFAIQLKAKEIESNVFKEEIKNNDDEVKEKLELIADDLSITNNGQEGNEHFITQPESKQVESYDKTDVVIDEIDTKKCNEQSEQIQESEFGILDIETNSHNVNQDEKDSDDSFDEESFDIINEQGIFNVDNENGNNSNTEDENFDNIIDADDGIDEEIFDYNDRPDDSYNQSEDGENNNDDFDTYSETQINEIQENLYSYNNDSVNSVSNGKYNQEDENLTEILENATISTDKDFELDSEKVKHQENNKSVNNDIENKENIVLDKQFDEMYDDSIKNRRQSRIQRDYDGIVEKMNTTYDDDVASVTTDDMIEQIYFKDLSPSRFERLGSEESFCSNYSSISQGSLNTRSKYKGLSHARQIKSDRLRSRYGIAPAIGKFANFENTDDITVSYIPRKEYNWRKNFKLDDLDIDKNETKSVETKTKENLKFDKIDNNLIENNDNIIKTNTNITDGDNKYKSAEPLGSENAEKILNEKIDTIYDEALKNRRKSRLEKEFEKIAEETDVQAEEFQELDSIPTQKILEDILNSPNANDTNSIQENQIEMLQKSEKTSKKIKIKKKVRKNSIINNEIPETTILNRIESNEIMDTVEKPKKNKTSRKNSLVAVKNDDDNENIELTSKVIKKSKKSKKRQSIDDSEQSYFNDNENVNQITTSTSYMMIESNASDKINESGSTPNESIIDDAEKYSNPSTSNSLMSLKTDDIRDQNDQDISEAKGDHIRENDILELIKDSSILGSSF